MTQPEFVAQLEAALQQTGQPFDRSQIIEFVADCWPWMEADQDVAEWAQLFLDSRVPPTSKRPSG
jgi:hypothetical protein